MATDINKERLVKYLNKDLRGFKRDLIRNTQAHFSGVFQDFNETSPGMAVLEMVAYIGDVLSFYQDRQFEELKGEQARQIENVVSFAKSRGYRPLGKRAARGEQAFILEIPATTRADGTTVPDETYCPVLLKGSSVSGPNGVVYETLDDIAFSASLGREVTGSVYDETTGVPTFFAVQKRVEVIAGETKTATFTIGDFEQFKTIELPDDDVLEVISIEDSDDNVWYQVDYLAQDTVFDATVNTDADSETVPYILKLLSVPRRFIVDRDPVRNRTSCIFGSGDGLNFDDELIPNLADLALPLAGRATFTSVSLDPQNFLKTRSLGLSPFDTVLTVTYRVGGGSETNVPPGSVKDVSKAYFQFSSTGLDTAKKGAVEQSIETYNYRAITGGGPEETISEIKANSAAYFAAQDRIVTREDYIARTLTLPEKFGKPDKVFVQRSAVNPLAMDLFVLTRDDSGFLVSVPTALKNNIATYLSKYRMETEGINILDGRVINLRCEFGVTVSPKLNRTEVLAKCLKIARARLDTKFMQISQPIIVSQLVSEIQDVPGVVSVFRLSFTNAFGTIDGLTYSSTRFDVNANMRDQILYAPAGSCFEVKFPAKDIVGVAK